MSECRDDLASAHRGIGCGALVLALALIAGCEGGSAPKVSTSTAATGPVDPLPDPQAWSATDRALRLGLAVHGEQATVWLENMGESPLTVIAAGGLSLHLEGGGTSRDIPIGVDPVHLDRPETFTSLPPHARLERHQDLGTPARRQVGTGGRAMPAGRYRVSVTYSSLTAARGSWWTGSLHAGPVDVNLE